MKEENISILPVYSRKIYKTCSYGILLSHFIFYYSKKTTNEIWRIHTLYRRYCLLFVSKIFGLMFSQKIPPFQYERERIFEIRHKTLQIQDSILAIKNT